MSAEEWRNSTSDMAVQQFDIAAATAQCRRECRESIAAAGPSVDRQCAYSNG